MHAPPRGARWPHWQSPGWRPQDRPPAEHSVAALWGPPDPGRSCPSEMDAARTPAISVEQCYVFKSRLQEYAQKAGLPTPEYQTHKEGPSHEPVFKSTVTVNNVKYDSLPGFFNRKAAEQSAAEVALKEILKSVPPADSLPAIHETGLCKNLLQEYAQKMNYAVPSYLCTKQDAGSAHFVCTVEIGGISYIGAAAKTKKDAEIKAARTALLAIQRRREGGSDGSPQLLVVPEKKRSKEPPKPPEVSHQLGPKKSKFKKKRRYKKPIKPVVNHGQVGALGPEVLNSEQVGTVVGPEAGTNPQQGSTLGHQVFDFEQGGVIQPEAASNPEQECSFGLEVPNPEQHDVYGPAVLNFGRGGIFSPEAGLNAERAELLRPDVGINPEESGALGSEVFDPMECGIVDLKAGSGAEQGGALGPGVLDPEEVGIVGLEVRTELEQGDAISSEAAHSEQDVPFGGGAEEAAMDAATAQEHEQSVACRPVEEVQNADSHCDFLLRVSGALP